MPYEVGLNRLEDIYGNLLNNKNFTTIGLDIFITRKGTKNLGYFRNVNFLVKFFGDRGFDTENQTPLEITREQAEELLDYCNQVLEDHSKAEELLPTMEGFSFRSTDYNKYYFNNVEKVRDYIEDSLIPQFNDLGDDEFIYFETLY